MLQTPRPISVVKPELVRISEIWPQRRLPVLVEPEVGGVNLAGWLSAHGAEVDRRVGERATGGHRLAHLCTTGLLLARLVQNTSLHEGDFQIARLEAFGS